MIKNEENNRINVVNDAYLGMEHRGMGLLCQEAHSGTKNSEQLFQIIRMELRHTIIFSLNDKIQSNLDVLPKLY